ncbi:MULTISPECIES: putative sulfate/molybdate transporter [Haloferax]|uniref:Sulfate transporter n=2 Tax=Haloferax TaxID=2251 RepID=A0A6G1Z1C5_9EURY|nr:MULTISPECIES: putative sulfate/molybdate transporter [Haloferax]KAB1187664.1 sulfate transporter [Haloferax sp. CBA1149]MRW80323.1 sulfate transporter [Haloferax marinisediminis]
MAVSFPSRDDSTLDFAWNEFTGAVGDSVTVLPIVVALSLLSDLSLSLVLVWFGVFQVVWGLSYGVPLSVEPMKALAALVIAGAISTAEVLVAGGLLGVVLLGIGRTNSLARVSRYIGSPVVRGVQFGVALVLLETGLELGWSNPGLAGLAAAVAVVALALGRVKLSALAVLLVGGAVAAFHTGLPSPTLPSTTGVFLVDSAGFTMPAIEGALAQLAMTVGNAALATSVLLADYFDRDISADDLATSMGVMNLVAVPFGGFPMCHGSGGVAGKYAFGARTAGANVILGVGYILVALVAVEIVAAYPLAMLGVVLAIIALQLARTSIRETEEYVFVVGIGVLGVVVNLGVAFVVGIVVWVVWERWIGGRSWMRFSWSD